MSSPPDLSSPNPPPDLPITCSHPRAPPYLPMSGTGHVQALGQAVGSQLGHPAMEQVLRFDLKK